MAKQNIQLWRRTTANKLDNKNKEVEVDREYLRKEDINITKQPPRTSKKGEAKNTWCRGLPTELSKIWMTWKETKRTAMYRKKWRETVVALGTKGIKSFTSNL
ncbi:Hypothetical predicted protein [Mytilus galloprovincialis]|uniref:Uncharacterized protein n=1 Tax=Mytilus galloprovincialis TaxID=29158 RepID=A0A8B6HP29_MYTGA|nr:Hypothetical predicted protein [Mytilus galloprovincialis]